MMKAALTQAACATEPPELFFPIGSTGDALLQIERAKAICRQCPIVDACLDNALDRGEEHGVWGGLDEKQRRSIRRKAARYAQPITVLAQQVRRDRAPKDPIRDIYLEHTRSGPDGHTIWTAVKTSVWINGAYRTPGQVAFLLGHGREPDGRVCARCRVTGCVTPEHLTDRPMRLAESAGAVEDQVAA